MGQRHRPSVSATRSSGLPDRRKPLRVAWLSAVLPLLVSPSGCRAAEEPALADACGEHTAGDGGSLDADAGSGRRELGSRDRPDSATPGDARDGAAADATDAARLDGRGDRPAGDRVSWHGNGQLLWNYHRDNGQGPLRSSLAIGNSGQHVFSGGYFGGGKMFRLAGDGTPLWEFDRDRSFGVAAAESDDIFYGVWDSYDDSNRKLAFEVYKFHAASATPDWTYDGAAHGYFADGVDAPGLLACTPDGSVFAVAGTAGSAAVILFFRPQSPTPFSVYQDATLAGIRQLRLTADGKKCLFHAAGKVYRVDVDSATLEGSADVGSSTDCFAISPDGSVAVHGFTALRVLEWKDGKFVLAGRTYLDLAAYVETAAVAADNQRIVTAWSSDDSLQLFVARYHKSQLDQPTWVHALAKGQAGPFVDQTSQIDLSADGEIIAVGSWGTQSNAHPELLVLRDSAPATAFFDIDTVGSVFAVDLTPDGSYLASGGKGTHASAFGNGGDVFAVRLGPPAP